MVDGMDELKKEFLEFETNTSLTYPKRSEIEKKAFRIFLSPGYSALDRSKKKSDKKKALEFEEFLSSDRTIIELLDKMMELYNVEDLVKLREEIKKKYIPNKTKRL